jgi:hypothetical protein
MKSGRGVQKVMTYQHWDGYPSWTVPKLIRFFKWNKGRNTQFDYMVANWIYFSKKLNEHHIWYSYKTKDETDARLKKLFIDDFENAEFANNGNLDVKLSVGIKTDENDFDSWIDYVYVVDIIPKSDDGNDFEKEYEVRIHCYRIEQESLQRISDLERNVEIQLTRINESGEIIDNEIKTKNLDEDLFKPKEEILN